jgi:hypothetical protein
MPILKRPKPDMPSEPPPVTMDDIARRFLASPPTPKPPAKKKPRKQDKKGA